METLTSRSGPFATTPWVGARHRRRALALVAAVVAVLLLAGAALASAAVGTGVLTTQTQPSRTTWGVMPADTGQGSGRPNFVYEVEAGDELHDALVVANHSPIELTFRVYAADGFTTPSGFLDLLPADQPSTGLGTWVEVETPQITLDPGERTEVPFVLRVPSDARPGDHSGGVVTSIVTEDPDTGVRQDNRLGSRMHVRVAGALVAAVEVHDLDLDVQNATNPFAPGTTTVTYTVVNTGNVRVTGVATVTTTGPFGTNRRVERVALPELVTGSTAPQEVVVAGVWPLLRRTVSVEVTAEPVGLGSATAAAAAPATVSVVHWSIPWSLLGVLVIVVTTAVVVGRRRSTPTDPGPVAGLDAEATPGPDGDAAGEGPASASVGATPHGAGVVDAPAE